MKTKSLLTMPNATENAATILASELPGDHLKHAVWHQLPKNKVKGDELKCPRIRKGPTNDDGDESSSSGSNSNSDVESGKHIKLKRNNYKSKEENWKKAKFVNFSYQDLGHPYQVKNFMRVVKSLGSCIQLHLVDNSLDDLHSVNLPKCHTLNVQKNHFSSFKELPSCKSLLHLNLSENNISSLNGSDRFKSLQSLDLSLNPVQYTDSYRSRIFASFPNLKYLDGIPILKEDHPEEFDKNSCHIL